MKIKKRQRRRRDNYSSLKFMITMRRKILASKMTAF
jgi:hypothetical protein